MDCLAHKPAAMPAAEWTVRCELAVLYRLVAHFLPSFAFSKSSLSGNVHWVDAASGVPPARQSRPADAASTATAKATASGCGTSCSR